MLTREKNNTLNKCKLYVSGTAGMYGVWEVESHVQILWELESYRDNYFT